MANRNRNRGSNRGRSGNRNTGANQGGYGAQRSRGGQRDWSELNNFEGSYEGSRRWQTPGTQGGYRGSRSGSLGEQYNEDWAGEEQFGQQGYGGQGGDWQQRGNWQQGNNWQQDRNWQQGPNYQGRDKQQRNRWQAGFRAGSTADESPGRDYESDYGTESDRWRESERGTSERNWNEGPHTGRGPRGYQRSSERMQEDVCELLTQHGELDASEIDVRSENGEVTLEGSVSDRRAKRLAEEIAESARGVRDVHNRLRISGSDRNEQQSTTTESRMETGETNRSRTESERTRGRTTR